MSGGPRAQPVSVLADQEMLGDVVVQALAVRGRRAAQLTWQSRGVRRGPARHPQRPQPSGVLLCQPGDALHLSSARAVVAAGPERWLAVMGIRPSPAWGAVLAAGGAGVLPASDSLDRLFEALDRLEHGAPVMAPGARREALARWERLPARERRLLARLDQLTPGERRVLTGLYEGQTVLAIAATLGVSQGTVRSQVKGVLRKLGVSSQVAAVAAVSSLEDSGLLDE